MDFTRYMNKVLKVHVEDMDVVVQPGLKREELNEYATAGTNPLGRSAFSRQSVFVVPSCSYLKQYNLFFPLDPGPSASLGGMVGTSCSGTHAVRYGTMKENILRYSSLAHNVYIAVSDTSAPNPIPLFSLKVVLPNGKMVKTGQRSKKSSAGYDLTHLFVGSEGTLGVTTEITLRYFHPARTHPRGGRCDTNLQMPPRSAAGCAVCPRRLLWRWASSPPCTTPPTR